MGDAERSVLWLVVRSVWLGTTIVAGAVAVVFYLGVTGPGAQDLVDVSQVRVIAENPAVRALYGRPITEASPGAFIVWRYGQLVTMFASVWILLTTTRVLRGEEEAGRWDLVLAARLGRRRLTVLVLAVLVAASATVAVALCAAFVLAGESLRGSVLFSAGVGLVLATFVGVGAASSQVFGQRRHAAGLGGAVLGGMFLARMVADGAEGIDGLRWLTPFGWLEEVGPFASDRAHPIGLLLVLALGLAGATVLLVGRRDLGDGLVHDAGRAAARSRLLGDPLAFAWRSRVGGLVGWGAGIAALGVAIGGITSAFADFIATHIGFQEVAEDYGFRSLGSAEGFVGTMAAFTGVVLAFYAVVSVRGLWDDEETGRLDLVYGAPLTRRRWLVAGLLASVAVVLVVTLVAVVSTFAGIRLGGAAVTWQATAAGLVNTLPVVAVFFGLAVLLHGVRPEWGTAVAGGAAATAYLVSFIGPALEWPGWVLSLSPFGHLAVVPVEAVDWTGAVVMVGLGLVGTVGGVVGYTRRDLR
jgi:ABC-2 type transport system permease protein